MTHINRNECVQNLRLICALPFFSSSSHKDGTQEIAPLVKKKGKVFSNTTPCFTMGDRVHLPAVAWTLLPVALGILTLLPHSLLGTPAEEEHVGSSALLQRAKRSWVWNQFFVLEEYTGLEPLYIGKVSLHYKLHFMDMNMHVHVEV